MPLGRTTTFADYSWHGRPGRIVLATGLETVIGYDGGGRTATTGPSGTSTYHYAGGTSRLTGITGVGATSFGSNADDRLSQVRLGNNQQIAAYVYDLQGKRIRKHAGQTRSFHYDQDGHLSGSSGDSIFNIDVSEQALLLSSHGKNRKSNSPWLSTSRHPAGESPSTDLFLR